MKQIHSTYELSTSSQKAPKQALILYCQFHDIPLEQVCFFDIETTGLSPEISNVYLIGAAHLSADSLEITQWFADDYVSEASLLCEFAQYLSRFSCLMHYNGQRFDVPYLEKKYAKHKLPSPFVQLKSVDIYRTVRPFRALLGLCDCKLTTVEPLVHFQREDTFDGKDCIDLYSGFTQAKYLHEDKKRMGCYQSLLLHNHDDIIGTFCLSWLFVYLAPLLGSGIHSYATNRTSHLRYGLSLPCPAPSPVTFEQNGFSFHYEQCEVTITLPFQKQILYHFFSSPKDYYYLPDEDTAIHKSVASFVDKTHRVKATSKNCYVKKESAFLALPNVKKRDTEYHGLPIFWNIERTQAYIEVRKNLPTSYWEDLLILFCKKKET